MKTGQTYTRRFANPVGDHRALMQLQIERSTDELLRNLEQQTRRDDAELLRRWEEDLKRRENDLRKREDTPPVDG